MFLFFRVGNTNSRWVNCVLYVPLEANSTCLSLTGNWSAKSNATQRIKQKIRTRRRQHEKVKKAKHSLIVFFFRLFYSFPCHCVSGRLIWVRSCRSFVSKTPLFFVNSLAHYQVFTYLVFNLVFPNNSAVVRCKTIMAVTNSFIRGS